MTTEETVFKANCVTTGIGSVPLIDPNLACRTVLDYFLIPYWPQLPKRSFREGSPQFFEGFPGLVVDDIYRKIYVDSQRFRSEADAFLERAEKESIVSKEHASGLYEYLDFGERLKCAKAVKGQITGPVSLGLSVTDEEKKPIIYDDEQRGCLLINLRFKARYQEKLLRTMHPTTITFIDEPYLYLIYSPQTGYNQKMAGEDLKFILGGLEGLTGIHCCSNVDWPFLLGLGFDVISFDAYTYSDRFLLYPEDIKNFLQRNGIIAWGIVPTEDKDVSKENVDSLMDRLEDSFEHLSRRGIDRRHLLENSLVTPACGFGARSEDTTIRAFELTRGLSSKLREKYNLGF